MPFSEPASCDFLPNLIIQRAWGPSGLSILTKEARLTLGMGVRKEDRIFAHGEQEVKGLLPIVPKGEAGGSSSQEKQSSDMLFSLLAMEETILPS